MKHSLSKLIIPAKLICASGRILRYACVCEKDGKAIVTSRRNKRSNEPYPCYSVSKSTVSLALGFLFDKGLFDPNDKIADYLAEYFPKDVDQKWNEVKIEHLFHHRTGTADKNGFDKISDFDDGEHAWGKQDNLVKIFSMPIINTPGEVYLYSDANYYVLARLAEKLCGMDLCAFLAKNLFQPLGFANYCWTRDLYGHVMGGTGLMLRTEDYAKLGWLWLNKGEYDGVRYLSEKWMTLAIAASEDRKDNRNYAYGVRRLGKNNYSITGAMGQGLYFNVQKRFVYAWHATGGNCVMTICEFLDKLNLL